MEEKKSSYPTAEGLREAGFQFGRLTRFEEKSLAVKWGGRTFFETFEQFVGNEKPVIKIGDLVAFKKCGESLEVILLVPKLSIEETKEFRYAKEWSEFLRLIREFFYQREFIEVTTPSLVPSAAMEPYLEAFATEWRVSDKQKKQLYLPTSPEFHLKKLLAQGQERIYEIKTVFRNEELSSTHQPEFQMLEWYRSFDTLESIQKDVNDLFTYIANESSFFSREEREIRIYSVADLFKKYLDFELSPETSKEEMICLADSIGIHFDASDDWDDIYFRIFLDKIESQMEELGPIILKDYPPSQSALARLNSEGWADRFEFYWRGLEIGNAFHELNDPEEQRERWEKANHQRVSVGREPHPVDHEFIEALRHGMPPSGGIAIGLERLFMGFTRTTEVGDIKPFEIAELK